ncbi:MAG: hypothetical protein NZ894_06015, partial [Archaeoglobaceae archaeon]|nr:hypothetical protein [Archaeoglobaceae archaeon]
MERKVPFVHIWEEAYTKALALSMGEAMREFRGEILEILKKAEETLLKSARETEKKLKSIRKMLGDLVGEVPEERCGEIIEALVDAFIEGQKINVTVSAIPVSVEIPSLAPVAKA